MYNRKYTPERILELKGNDIFVFGSNLAGAHGGGAARLAYERFGAVWGEGVRITHEGYNTAVLNMASRTNLFRSLCQFTEYFINHVWYAKYITPVRTSERYPLERNFGGIYTPSQYHGASPHS